MDQESFEEGLKLGISTAVVVVSRVDIPRVYVDTVTAALKEFAFETDAMIALRRNGGIVPDRPAEHGDIFTTPVAHPGDFGLPVSRHDEVAAASSRVARRLSSKRARGETAEAGVQLHPRLAAQA